MPLPLIPTLTLSIILSVLYFVAILFMILFIELFSKKPKTAVILVAVLLAVVPTLISLFQNTTGICLREDAPSKPWPCNNPMAKPVAMPPKEWPLGPRLYLFEWLPFNDKESIITGEE